jgi:hypothetical protein
MSAIGFVVKVFVVPALYRQESRPNRNWSMIQNACGVLGYHELRDFFQNRATMV